MKQIDNVLIADEGMTLTNGEGFGKKVYLASGADASEWEEITDAEAAERKRDMEVAADEDYQRTLLELGVMINA